MSKILIIDDDLDMLIGLLLLFKKNGYEVETTTNGKEVWPKLNSFKPDLILLDIHLSGGLDGREICKQLKNDEKFSHIPVIFISADVLAESSFIDYGAQGFFPKGGDIKDLINSVKLKLK